MHGDATRHVNLVAMPGKRSITTGSLVLSMPSRAFPPGAGDSQPGVSNMLNPSLVTHHVPPEPMFHSSTAIRDAGPPGGPE